MASPGAIWKPPAGVCRMHDAGRHARIRLRRRPRATRKPRPPQELGRALAVDADQVGHHVGRACARRGSPAAPPRSPASPARVLRDDRVGGVVVRADLGDARPASRPSCCRRICAVRSVWPTSSGTDVATSPALTHTLDRALRGATRTPAGGSCCRMCPAGTFGSDALVVVDPQREARVRRGCADASLTDRPGQVGHAHLARAHGDAHGDEAETQKRAPAARPASTRTCPRPRRGTWTPCNTSDYRAIASVGVTGVPSAEPGRYPVTSARSVQAPRAKKHFQAVPVGARGQPAACVEERRRRAPRRSVAPATRRKPGARPGTPSTTPSFSSGSLEQVA